MKNRNKNFWLGILAMALVFTMTVFGCKESEEELRELSGSLSWNSGGIVNGIASVGTTITVNYSGTDTNNVSYQWCKNGTAIPGAVNQTFTLNEPGEYTVIVSAPGYKSRTYTIATVTETGPIPTALSWISLQADITRGGFNSVAWGNNKFVAVGEVGKIIYSSDGINWTAAPNSPFDTTISSAIRKVIWADNKFVAFGNHSGSNGPGIATSADGITWNKLTPVFNTTYAGISAGVAYGGGTFVMASGSYNPLFYSTDAINWTKVTQTNFGGDDISSVYSIAYGNGKFVAVGRKGNNTYIEVSADGISWTVNYTHFSSSINAIGVTYRNGTFVAVGDYDCEICYSRDDGGPWQAVVKSANDITLDKGLEMDFVGSGDHQFIKFIAYTGSPASASRRMRYSQDGITWTYGDDPSIGRINDLAWGDGKYVIVGRGNYSNQRSIAYSTN